MSQGDMEKTKAHIYFSSGITVKTKNWIEASQPSFQGSWLLLLPTHYFPPKNQMVKTIS